MGTFGESTKVAQIHLPERTSAQAQICQISTKIRQKSPKLAKICQISAKIRQSSQISFHKRALTLNTQAFSRSLLLVGTHHSTSKTIPTTLRKARNNLRLDNCHACMPDYVLGSGFGRIDIFADFVMSRQMFRGFYRRIYLLIPVGKKCPGKLPQQQKSPTCFCRGAGQYVGRLSYLSDRPTTLAQVMTHIKYRQTLAAQNRESRTARFPESQAWIARNSAARSAKK